MAKRHYIVMIGLPGCIPSSCDVYKNLQRALDAAIDLAWDDNYRGLRAELWRNGIAELKTGEVLEVVTCDCATPEIHSDSGEGPY